MEGRNRGPQLPTKGGAPHGLSPPFHEHPLARGVRSMPPHSVLLEEMREPQFAIGHRPPLDPHHPAIIDERLAAQHQEIQALLVDNQRLAAIHVALKQELEAAQYNLQRMAQFASSLQAEKDMQMRELFDNSIKLEVDLHGVEAMRAELMQVCTDIMELTSARQELNSQVQAMTQNFNRASSDLQQAPALKAEIEGMKQELQQARAAIEYEKKGYAENYEHGKVMENNLISMARELEKLRAEFVNVEKRAHAAAAVGNQGYSGNYGNVNTACGGNSYPATHGINPAQSGPEGYPPYGPGPGSWGAYDMQ